MKASADLAEVGVSMTALPLHSLERFAELEKTIRKSQGDYVTIGRALAEIQNSRFYKEQYNTFEEYCEKQWGFARQTAYDYIHAAGVHVRLIVQNLPSFTQAIELSRLPFEQQEEVANKINFNTATVKDVKSAVNAKMGKSPVRESHESKEISLETVLDAFVTKIVMQPYGYYAAKFKIYAFQHPTELEIVRKAKLEVYQEIQKICGIKLS
jgi:hypothetical protein